MEIGTVLKSRTKYLYKFFIGILGTSPPIPISLNPEREKKTVPKSRFSKIPKNLEGVKYEKDYFKHRRNDL